MARRKAASGSADSSGNAQGRRAFAPIAALGIVYGDIGTSPLYAIRECFVGERSVSATDANVLGVLCLVTWSLVLVISVKYLGFILRANHDGEGGILALMELVKRGTRGSIRKLTLAVGLFGAALLYGDSMITPAISVLSAVEGLDVAAGDVFAPYILPVALGVLSGLFLLQQVGTSGIGKLFGPVMLLWFGVLGVSGAIAVADSPSILAALNPVHAIRFFAENGTTAVTILGIVFLVVTGGEALYADLGHFGRRPIVRSWYAVVLPALLLNYFGQGALILEREGVLTNPFYELFPAWAIYPMVALATTATIIASQAVISGAFSLTFQAIQLGYLPRLQVRHTSSELRGQIYVPAVNVMLFVATLGLVLGFRQSGNLAAAYGVAIAATMTITTALFAAVAHRQLAWPAAAAAAAIAIFMLIDMSFLAATVSKVLSGGWLPLVIAGLVVTIMTTWHRGRTIAARRVRDSAEPLTDFLERQAGGGYRRVPGQAVYLTQNSYGTPHVLERNLLHNRALHRIVTIYTAKITKRPYVAADRRLKVERLRDDLFRLVAYYGFMERVDVPADLAAAAKREQLPIDPDRVTYFVGDEKPMTRQEVGMPGWRSWLFVLMQRNTQPGHDAFRLPANQVIEIGTQVPV